MEPRDLEHLNFTRREMCNGGGGRGVNGLQKEREDSLVLRVRRTLNLMRKKHKGVVEMRGRRADNHLVQ